MRSAARMRLYLALYRSVTIEKLCYSVLVVREEIFALRVICSFAVVRRANCVT